MDPGKKYAIEIATTTEALSDHSRMEVAAVLEKDLNLCIWSPEKRMMSRKATALDLSLRQMINLFKKDVTINNPYGLQTKKVFSVRSVTDTSQIYSDHLQRQANILWRGRSPPRESSNRDHVPDALSAMTNDELWEDASTLRKEADLYPSLGPCKGKRVLRRYLIILRAKEISAR